MKKLIVIGAAATVLLATAAMAADMPVKAPTAVAAPIFNWTGFYAGASIGGRWSDPTWTTSAIGGPLPGQFRPADPATTPVDFDSSTVRIGGYLGYNWQFAPQWLVGIEGDIAWGDSSKTSGGVPGSFGGTPGFGTNAGSASVDSSSVKERWDASIRGRLGYLITPAWLVYATGGVAFMDVEVGASCTGTGPSWCGPARSESVSSTLTGWTVSGGVETALTRNWLARIEYRYADYGSFDHTFFTVPSTADEVVSSIKFKTHTVLGGIAYKF